MQIKITQYDLINGGNEFINKKLQEAGFDFQSDYTSYRDAETMSYIFEWED